MPEQLGEGADADRRSMLSNAGIAAVKSLVQRSPIHWLVLCGGLLIAGAHVPAKRGVSRERPPTIARKRGCSSSSTPRTGIVGVVMTRRFEKNEGPLA